MVNACGECTECCRVMGVVEIGKAPQTWCTHCTKGNGCSIYPDRPPTCAGFTCGWLADGLSAELRPDRCHIVLVYTYDGDMIAKCDPLFPDALGIPVVHAYLRSLVNKGKVVFVFTGEELREMIFSSTAMQAHHRSAELTDILGRAAQHARREMLPS